MEVDMEAEYEKIEVEMYKEAQTPLYEGCPIANHLHFIITKLGKYTRVSNTFVNKLFTLL
jgi:hypothetical protein